MVKPVDVPHYDLLPQEPEPAAKLAAVAAVEAALTWRGGEVGIDAARRRVTATGASPAAVDPLAALLDGASWSSVRIVYPQYGGLLADRTAASVMIPVEQLRDESFGPTPRAATIDARLVRRNGTWIVTELRFQPLPRAVPSLSPAAAALLADERVVLPGAARADVAAGRIDDRVLSMLTQLGTRWRIDVLVMTTGHPVEVFGTDRPSNHTSGRAVDVWAIDGVPVVDRKRSAWQEVMRAAAQAGANEIGGPSDLDGVRGRRPYFSDQLHQDHLHLGFEAN